MITTEKFVSATGQVLNYIKYIPDGKQGEKLPLVISLHGFPDRGNVDGRDIDRVFTHGYPMHIKAGKDYPFILVAPQCPDTTIWNSLIETLGSFVDFVVENNNVDCDRVYLTGMSMGGMGVWLLAQAYPEKFAAIVPICGISAIWYTKPLLNLPIWAFHGSADPTIPCMLSERIVDAVNRDGGNAKLTIYEGAGHNVWTDVFSRDDVIAWMLSKNRV